MNEKEYSLIELRAAANLACELAINRKSEIGGAVNWADLGCHEARRWFNDRGELGYTVTIEEASEDASQLRLFIGAELRAAGFENVEVSTEW